MEILSLKIKNFLSISDIEIKPGQVNQIVGANNQGKTTIIKALEFARAGSSDGSLVKFGEEQAEVIVELADEVTIRRKISKDGKQSLDVRKGDFKAPSPQSMLDVLFEGSSFNPLELLDPKRRAEAILSSINLAVTPEILGAAIGLDPKLLPPLDYNQHGLKILEQAHKYFYQRRAEANKDSSEKKKRFDTYFKDLPQLPTEVPSKPDLDALIEAIHKSIKETEDQLVTIGQRKAAYTKAKEEIKIQSARIAEIDSEIKALQSAREEVTRAFDLVASKCPRPVEENDAAIIQKNNELKVRLQEVKGKFAEIDRKDAIVRQHSMVAGYEEQWKKAHDFSEGLTVLVNKLNGEVQAQFMSNAEMPVAGLQYKDGSFAVDGVPIDNLSSSKALQLAVGVARKLAKKTKLICIDGAEALDEASYNALRTEIDNDGYTYFVTKVGDPFKVAGDQVVRMQEGRVAV